MKKTLLCCLALISFNILSDSTYYPTSFQKAFHNRTLKGQELKKAIFLLLSMKHVRKSGENDLLSKDCRDVDGQCYSQRSLSYYDARKILFGVIHKEEDQKGAYVKDVYCGKVVRIDSRDPIPNHRVLNCEHTWPQSRFNSQFPKEVQKTDIHHLYPTDSRANSERGNHPFSDVNGSRVSGCNSSYLGGAIGEGGLYFEPPEEHKGNVARALFYFSTRYQTKITSIEEKALRLWHELDPVDEEERQRNEKIYQVQGNRNPFIDYPQLVDGISDF